MDFNNLELSLLLMLVEQKISDLKFGRLSLSFDKRYMDINRFNALEKEYKMTIESTECLKCKIIKKMEE